jgi:hypothetical protein
MAAMWADRPVLLIGEADAWLRSRWSTLGDARPDRITPAAVPDRVSVMVRRLPRGAIALADTGAGGEAIGLALAETART